MAPAIQGAMSGCAGKDSCLALLGEQGLSVSIFATMCERDGGDTA